MIKKYKYIVLACLVLTGCSHIASTPSSQPYYTSLQTLVLADILPLPPTPGLVWDQRDLAAVLNVQRHRTPAQVELAQQDVERSIFRFQSVFGSAFVPERLPLTTALFDRLFQEEERLIEPAKTYYARPRPSLIDARVKPIIDVPQTAAYPSGHTCFAYVTARVLAQMVPEKEKALYARARVYAHNRIVAGVHYPTDIKAGQIAAKQIVDALLKDPQFQIDFAASRDELRTQLRLNQ